MKCFDCQKEGNEFYKDSRMPTGKAPSCIKCFGKCARCLDCGDYWKNYTWLYYCPGCKSERTEVVNE